MLTDEAQARVFRAESEVDFSYSIPGVARFRVNAFRQRGSVSLVCRAIPFQIKTAEELMLPPVITELADEERGLILMTGTTGSGKSTTLAAMIDHINSNYAKHIVTIEDPIEFLHHDKLSIINQREVGEDTASFARALRRVLRQDPDVILVGEMRDEETVRTALSAAETGHLVLSTIHTVDASESVNRIIDFFPQTEQRQARAMLAGTLKAVVSQRLVPTADGLGRVASCEILRMTGRVRDMIVNPDETGRLHEVIAEGGYYGMQTFDQALLAHVQAGASRWTRRSRPPRTRTTSSCWSAPTASATRRSRRSSARKRTPRQRRARTTRSLTRARPSKRTSSGAQDHARFAVAEVRRDAERAPQRGDRARQLLRCAARRRRRRRRRSARAGRARRPARAGGRSSLVREAVALDHQRARRPASARPGSEPG